LLFNELIKHTWPSHPDLPALRSVSAQVSAVASGYVLCVCTPNGWVGGWMDVCTVKKYRV
jgi:hypothetical protein